jgi:hypothetical protein
MAYTLKNPTGKPSEKAFTYALDLVNQANCNDPAAKMKALESLPTLDAQGIANLINLLKPIVAGKGATVAEPTPAKVVEGWYLVDGEKYQIKLSKKGFPHIYKPTFIHGASQEGAKIIAQVEANGAALAIAYGKATGTCGICSKTLTDPKSIAAGIGPVCAGKF